MTAPLVVMVAGPNGSGKSTLTNALRAAPGLDFPALYINADEIALAQGLNAVAAQQAAAKLRLGAIAEHRDVMFETVMSHPSKLAELQQAKTAGYRIAIHFVSTEDPSINVERVALRVSAGGHDVPERTTRERYVRTMAFAPVAMGYADQALVFDNSRRGAEGGLQLQAQLVGPTLELLTESPVKWIGALRGAVNDRAHELARIQDDARRRGMPLHLASLGGGQTRGTIEWVGSHYALQQDVQTKALVVHDRAVLPETLRIEPGRSYRIDYLDGVGQGEAMASIRTHGEAPHATMQWT